MQGVFSYFAAHPGQFAALLTALALAGIGLWYVISHHLQVILITLLCSAGVASGVVVLYRGAAGGTRDLLVSGLFLIAVFPVIFWQALRQSAALAAALKAAAKAGEAPRKPAWQRRERLVPAEEPGKGGTSH